MLPKNGHSVKKKYFLYSIIKIYDVNYYQKHRKNIFCNLTIFELVNEIGDFESLCFCKGEAVLQTLQRLIFVSQRFGMRNLTAIAFNI